MEETGKSLRNDYAIVLSVAFASFIARLNLYTVNVSLPTISNAFNVGTPEASRIITSYLLIITSTLILFGKMGDRIGFKGMFINGYFVFVAGSVLCGLSQGIGTLTGARFLQGLGSSMLLATSFAIIAKCIPKDRLGWAFGINATATAIGVAAGAPLGGIIAGYLSWRWIFLLNVPLGIIAIICARLWIPDMDRQGDDDSRKSFRNFDFSGAMLSFIALAALLYGVSSGSERGWTSHITYISLAVFVIFFSLFLSFEKRHKDPLLDMAILKNKPFSLALTATALAYMLIAGNAFLLPFYLEIMKGLTSAATGMVLLVYSFIYVFVSPYAGRLSDKTNPIIMCVVAMLSAAVNSIVFSFSLNLEGLIPVYLFLAWLGFSYVFFLSPVNSLVMALAPKGKEGIGSGLLNTAINLSMVFGVAIFELVFSEFLGNSAAKGISLHALEIPKEIMMKAFSAAYVTGGILCLLGALSSFLVKNGPRKETHRIG